MNTIPGTLAPFFQEYDVDKLDPQTAASLIIERTLQFGNRLEIRWLFTQYTRAQITDWFRKYAKERLPEPHTTFWRIVLENALASFHPTLADSAWGNLVFLANNVRLGFYGYGFPLVVPLVVTEGIRLASIEDIALMKMDALLSRAARKDFYDLYFICRKIPLRTLLDLAPQKYANVRDFETQTVKRLVYFENAEADEDPMLFQPVSWQEVKEFFVGQANEIGSSWL